MRISTTKTPGVFGVALMLGISFLSRCVLGAGALLSPATEERNFRRYSIEQFLEVTDLVDNSFSPDGSQILVSSDQDGVFNAYAVSVDTGSFTRLTESHGNAIEVQGYFPEDDRFLYLADQGGDELDHLYVQERNGTRTDLTPGEGHKARFLGWAGDGKSLFVGTNERDRRYFDVYEIAVNGFARSLIFKNDAGYRLFAVSPDRRYVALGRRQTRSKSDLLLYDRQVSSFLSVGSASGEVEHGFKAFSFDGKSVYFTTDENDEFARLVKQDLATGERQIVVDTSWDVIFAVTSRAGRYLVTGINKDASTEIRLFDARSLEPLAIPSMPEGDITSVIISRDESQMSFYASTGRSPSDLYVYDFSDRGPRRLTKSLSQAIDEEHLVGATVTRFISYDGLEIPGLLYLPHEASPINRVPALVWVHGGPGGQVRVGYNALVQYLVNHGYAILAINNRGSSGYGKSFFKADDRRHGRADLEDCIASKRLLAATGYVDPSRIGIIGTSYGGYMALAALTFRPEAFDAGVDIFGISDWIHTLENMPPWWGSIREALLQEIGDPRRDREYLKSISPVYHAKNIKRPLLVLQGARDPRISRSGSDQIVAAARANGSPVEYILFGDEGHSIQKKENRLVAFRSIRIFLDKHLETRPLDSRRSGLKGGGEPDPAMSQVLEPLQAIE